MTFDVPATNPVVTLVGSLTPTLVVAKGSANYSFAGSGVIAGGASLVKSNSGTLTIANSAANTFSGKTTIAGGAISIAASPLVQAHSPCKIPAIIIPAQLL